MGETDVKERFIKKCHYFFSTGSHHYRAESFYLYALSGDWSRQQCLFGKEWLGLGDEKARHQAWRLCPYEVDGKDYVGRVIALEKDQVTYMDDLLYLNGQVMSEEYIEKMREKYLASAGSSGYYTHDFSIMDLKDSKSDKITKDSYLILNDRRENTKDSREFGLIKASQIKGVVEFRLSPLSKFGFIETK